jgi:DNA topoisomerase VI subunit A
LDYILNQLRAGKSPSPFSLTDSDFNHDLLAVLRALSNIQAETPYRVFSVRVFNDTKRFDDLKPALIRLVRRVNPEWKNLPSEDLLRELNLVANPTYIHLAGNWELTDINGQIINLDSFTPSVGFPASQITSIRKITIRAESVLCIENLTSFHQQVDRYTGKQVNNGTLSTQHESRNTCFATICLMGNPSPAIRRLLQLISEETPLYLWSDLDYGGFNILAQLRKQISPRIQPYLMDIATFENYVHLSRPLTQLDARNLKRLTLNPNVKDIHPTIEHLLKRGLKLEQEAIHTSIP